MMDNELRLPPHSLDAEEAVIGSLLIDPEATTDLNPTDFYSEKTRWVYEACLALSRKNIAVDQLTVSQELGDKLELLGGSGYLSLLISQVPTSLHINYYSQIVRKFAFQRELIDCAGQIGGLGYEGQGDEGELLARAQTLLDSMGELPSELVTPKDLAEAMTTCFPSEGRGDSIAYGFRDLDQITSGMYGGDLIIIGGRPRTGKTQLMTEVSLKVAKTGKKVLYASAEMPRRQMGERVMSIEAGIHIKRLRTGEYSQVEEGRMMAVVGKVAELPLHLLEGRLTSNRIAQQAKILKKTQGLDIIFVDYLQLLLEKYSKEYGSNLNERIGYISGNLKNLAVDLDIPVVVASQFSRDMEKENRKPQLSDLRDSGSLEQDADTVLLLLRPELDKKDVGEDKGILMIGVAKQRQIGDIGNIKLKFSETLRRYVDLKES